MIKAMKGRLLAGRSMAARICRPVVWLWGVNPLRRNRAAAMDPCPRPAPETGLDLSVMSFNIRRGTAKDGKHHWVFRRERVGELLNSHRPDVLGLQEAMDFQMAEIGAMLPGYERVGDGNRGGSKGLHTAIFYDAARFAASESGTFWFSDTPDVPGSRGWGNILPRTCTWVRLSERETGKAFYFYNVHLDHISPRSRKNSVVQLMRFIHGRPSPDPLVLTGDFNAREKSAPIQYLKGNAPLRIRAEGRVSNPEPLTDTFRARYPHFRRIVTFHGFRRYFFRFKLDYIFTSPAVRIRDAQIIQPRRKRCYPSDHFPLLTWIDLPDGAVSSESSAYRQTGMAG